MYHTCKYNVHMHGKPSRFLKYKDPRNIINIIYRPEEALVIQSALTPQPNLSELNLYVLLTNY